VESGVPQGTVLGPTLFSIYIDDLEAELKKLKLGVKIMKFADDTKGGRKVDCEADRDSLQRALDCLREWAERWGMSFNTDICKIMHVGLHNPTFEYTMRGTKISTTEEENRLIFSFS
jgi:ribonuclease P/MRP protein subunit RPP40